MSKFARKGKVPEDFHIIEDTLNELEAKLKMKMLERVEGAKSTHSTWPMIQINNQKTRFVHEMYYKYGLISEECFNYCRKNKIIDVDLSDKWLEPGYEKLCCMTAIATINHQFHTVALCRLPYAKDKVDKVENPYSGCRGCASGKAGEKNIFGNEFGISLADAYVRKLNGEVEEEKEVGLDEAKQEEQDEEEKERKREEKRLKKEMKRAKKEKKKQKKLKKLQQPITASSSTAVRPLSTSAQEKIAVVVNQSSSDSDDSEQDASEDEGDRKQTKPVAKKKQKIDEEVQNASKLFDL